MSWNHWHLSHKCPRRAIFCVIECASLAGTIGRATLPSSLARPVWDAISPKSSYNTGNIMATTTFIIILHTHTSTHVYINTHAGSAVNLYKKTPPHQISFCFPPPTPSHIIYTTSFFSLHLQHHSSTTTTSFTLPSFLFVFWHFFFFRWRND